MSKFGGLGTFEQLIQGHKIEKLHVMAGLKLFKKCFHRYFDSLFLILVGCSLRSKIAKMIWLVSVEMPRDGKEDDEYDAGTTILDLGNVSSYTCRD